MSSCVLPCALEAASETNDRAVVLVLFGLDLVDKVCLSEYRNLLKELGIGGRWIGIGHCAVGYADCELPDPPKRKDGRVYNI